VRQFAPLLLAALLLAACGLKDDLYLPEKKPATVGAPQQDEEEPQAARSPLPQP